MSSHGPVSRGVGGTPVTDRYIDTTTGKNGVEQCLVKACFCVYVELRTSDSCGVWRNESGSGGALITDHYSDTATR